MMGLRINLGKDTARLQLLVGTLSSGSELAISEFLQTYTGDRILFLPGASRAVNNQEYTLETGRLYLVDPLGNIMMRYSTASDPGGIMGDLKRLLRYSRIG
jgi:cytochrome oxidase Cu insertion factor (SCO1/SenC/PrrC family)